MKWLLLLLLLLFLLVGCQTPRGNTNLDGRVVAVVRTFEDTYGIVVQTRNERVAVYIASRDYPTSHVVKTTVTLHSPNINALLGKRVQIVGYPEKSVFIAVSIREVP
jgi:uncharacterized lipoprotein YajG